MASAIFTGLTDMGDSLLLPVSGRFARESLWRNPPSGLRPTQSIEIV